MNINPIILAAQTQTVTTPWRRSSTMMPASPRRRCSSLLEGTILHAAEPQHCSRRAYELLKSAKCAMLECKRLRARRYLEGKRTRTWGLALYAPLCPCCGWLPPALPDDVLASAKRAKLERKSLRAKRSPTCQGTPAHVPIRTLMPILRLATTSIAQRGTKLAQRRITAAARRHKGEPP